MTDNGNPCANVLLDSSLNGKIDNIFQKSPLPTNESPVNEVSCNEIEFKKKKPVFNFRVFDIEFRFNIDGIAKNGSISLRNRLLKNNVCYFAI